MIDKNTPRLSELPGNLWVDTCAECGAKRAQNAHITNHKRSIMVSRWQEHDHYDKKEARVVALCKTCSDRLIAPHPRLYRQLGITQFVPGSAPICERCKHQYHLSCFSPRARFNGGPGLVFTPEPCVVHVCAGRHSYFCEVESEPIKNCSGKEIA